MNPAGVHAMFAIVPPGRHTRTISSALSWWCGANITPTDDITQSNSHPSVTAAVVDHFRVHAGAPDTSSAVDSLTEREREVLLHLARGRSNAEIAEALVVAPGTVKTHVAAVLAKLGVRDRVQAVIAAHEAGLVRP